MNKFAQPFSNSRARIAIAFSVCFFFFSALPGFCIGRDWTGADSANWSDPNNWSPAGIPAVGDNLQFGYVSDSHQTNVNDLGGVEVESLSFNNAAYEIDGNAIQVDGGIYSGDPAADDFSYSFTTTINCPLIIGEDWVEITSGGLPGVFTSTTVDTYLNGGIQINQDSSLVLDAQFNGGSDFPVIANSHIYINGPVSGAGDLYLDAGAYDGDRSFIEFDGPANNSITGTIYIGNLPGLDSGGGEITFNKTSGVVTSNTVDVINGGINNELHLGSGANQMGGNSTLIVEKGATLTLSGANLTVGTLVMKNVSADALPSTLGGSTTLGLNNGIVSQSDNSSVHPTINETINLNGREPATVNGTSPEALEITSEIEGVGMNKEGSGVLLFSGYGFTSASLHVDQGTFRVNSNTALQFPSVVLNGGTLELDGVNSVSDLIVNSNNTALVAYDQCTWMASVQLNANLNLTQFDTKSVGTALVFTNSFRDSSLGAISGTGGINVMPSIFTPSKVIFAGTNANTFTGPLHVYGPLVEFQKSYKTPACFGDIFVGGAATPAELRWLNSYEINGTNNVTIYANGTANLNNQFENYGTLTFYGGTLETGSGYAAVYGDITAYPTNVTAVISGNLIRSTTGSEIFNVGLGNTSSGTDLLISAVINTEASYFVKQGSGTLALTAANNLTGPTLLEDGIIDINNGNGLGTTPIVLFNGAELRLSGSGTLNQGMELLGDGVNGAGAIDVLANNNVTFNGNLLMDGETSFSTASGALLQIGGVISGTGAVTKLGIGTLNLFGTGNNTFNGDLLANAGSVLLGKSGGAVAVPYNLSIGTKTSLNGTGGTVATVTNLNNFQIHQGDSVTVNGGSLYNLNNFFDELGYLTLVNGGSVSTGTGTLSLDASGVSHTFLTVSPGQSGSSVISGKLNIVEGGSGIIAINPRFETPLGAGPELDIQAIVTQSDSGNLFKTGDGAMGLDTANTINSSMTVNGGTLLLKNSAALGSAASSLTVNGSGVVALSGGITIANRTLTLNGTNAVGIVQSTGGSNAWSSPVVLSQGAVMSVSPANGFLDFVGAFSGPGGLMTQGTGTFQFLGNVDNTYGGITTVRGTLLELGRENRVAIPGDVSIGDDTTNTILTTLHSDGGSQINPLANVAIHKSGFLDFKALPGDFQVLQQLQSVTGYGGISISNLAHLTFSNAINFEYFGTISGNGAFFKDGPGAMITWGDFDNTGGDTLLNGDWKFNGGAHGGSGVIVDGGQLRGEGSVDGFVSINSGGKLNPDSKSADHQGGIFRMGSLYGGSGSTIQLDLFGPSPTGKNDELLTGTVHTGLSNTTLNLNFNYPPREGDVITLINVSNGPAYTPFANLPAGSSKIGTVPVTTSYTGGSSGHDVTVTVTGLALGYVGYTLAEGNGNQTVEPDECNLLYVTLVNRRSTALTITNAFLRAMNSVGAVVTIPVASFPTIAASQTVTNLTPFQFKTDTNLPCGGTVSFELVLGVQNEGQFAIDFSPVSGSDCSHPTGPCDSCAVISGQIDGNSLTTSQPLYFVGAPSIPFPPKAYPGTNPAPALNPAPYNTHNYINNTTNAIFVTAELDFDCANAVTNALGVAAYLGNFDPNHPANGYLGDIGQGGPPYPVFSFEVPPSTNFTLVVMAQTNNLPCASYTLQLFGLNCPPPTIIVEPDTTQPKLKVDWSTAYPGWTLQQAGLLPGTFSNATAVASIVNGRYAITNITPVNQNFYRLKK